MAGWTLNNLTPNLQKDVANISLQLGEPKVGLVCSLALGPIQYDGSGDLTESQLRARILKASEEALEGALETVREERAKHES